MRPVKSSLQKLVSKTAQFFTHHKTSTQVEGLIQTKPDSFPVEISAVKCEPLWPASWQARTAHPPQHQLRNRQIL